VAATVAVVAVPAELQENASSSAIVVRMNLIIFFLILSLAPLPR
jgi:hypothetical protein